MMHFLRAYVNFFRLGRGIDHPDCPGQPSGYPAERRDRGEASPRDVWWIHGARDRREHAFGAETRTLLTALATA
jgi:hypothetical protein